MPRVKTNTQTLAFATVLSAAVPFATVAQAKEKEPTAIFEIGGAGNWTIPNGASGAPTVAVEFTPIKDWLEIENRYGAAFWLRDNRLE